MSFIIDKQTLNDLEIPGKKGKRSVQSLFNETKTKGGAEQITELFQYPLDSAIAIKKRLDSFKFFSELDEQFPINVVNLDLAEQYLLNTDERTLLNREKDSFLQGIKDLIQPNSQNQLLILAIKAILIIGKELDVFLKKIEKRALTSVFGETFLELESLRDIIPVCENPKWKQLTEFDRYFRFEKREHLLRLLTLIYSLDVNMTVPRVAKIQKFVFPTVSDQSGSVLEIQGLRHPHLKGAITNDIIAGCDENLIFLTGVNMAGKSTFMKSFGIAVFLAHLGFPVPASRMTFSVFDGLLTTINLSDNLSVGHSHFYAEVVRVRKMAEFIQKGKKMVIIVDELFRGTNVKDAFDATVAIASAFSKKDTSVFMISTHIIEAGKVLGESHPTISFVFLPTIMKEGRPVYTYRLLKGISSDRHGMLIVENEGILELLNNNHRKI
ncbi:MutS-related protein [Pedobacter hiemivivus]|uniref:DNA mismatch repair protein n=1 Tax=Pedobacter hiemivivus TaxID=2530454 RepID=A0A4V2MKP4_9SPHI|nr:DNA mismatch repair protein [Pedobacter hiemivivus]TCC98836.1 DNA mismatch repair protein [Pedobacter hiemivivus]